MSRTRINPAFRRCRMRHKIDFSTQQARRYHSYDHPSPPPYASTADSVLSAAMKHVPKHGFSQTSLQLGAKDAGYLPISTNLFPRGVFDLISYYLVTKRLALKDVVNGENGLSKVWDEKKFGLGARVRALLLERLRMNGKTGVIKRWPEALAVMAQPIYVPESLSELGRLADEIWFLAGDTSVDTSWYTKRGTLAGIYAAAEVYQTQDLSPDFADTEEFIDSRLAELKTAGEGVSAVSEWAGFTLHSAINVLRSKGMRI